MHLNLYKMNFPVQGKEYEIMGHFFFFGFCLVRMLNFYLHVYLFYLYWLTDEKVNPRLVLLTCCWSWSNIIKKINELTIFVFISFYRTIYKLKLDLEKIYFMWWHIVGPFYCEAVRLECVPTSHSGVMDSFFPGVIYTYLYCQAAKWSPFLRSGSLLLSPRLRSTC